MKEVLALHIIDLEDVNAKFKLHMDASRFALGAILYQKFSKEIKSVAFHSHKLNSAEKSYTTIDQEMLAIVDSCRHWRHCLAGMNFTVKTDHKAL